MKLNPESNSDILREYHGARRGNGISRFRAKNMEDNVARKNPQTHTRVFAAGLITAPLSRAPCTGRRPRIMPIRVCAGHRFFDPRFREEIRRKNGPLQERCQKR
jgi:hypothetical protein